MKRLLFLFADEFLIPVLGVLFAWTILLVVIGWGYTPRPSLDPDLFGMHTIQCLVETGEPPDVDNIAFEKVNANNYLIRVYRGEDHLGNPLATWYGTGRYDSGVMEIWWRSRWDTHPTIKENYEVHVYDRYLISKFWIIHLQKRGEGRNP